MQDQFSPLASGLLDTVSSTRGAILYRGASGWVALVPGTSGHFLKSNGSGADPSYAAAGGGSFDPAAATEITFTTGLGATQITGPTDQNLRLSAIKGVDVEGGNNVSGSGSTISIYTASGTSTNTYGGAIQLDTGTGNGNQHGGDYYFTAGGGGDTGRGGEFSFSSGSGGATSGNAGGFTFSAGNVAAGNAGNFTVTLADAAGTNKTGGSAVFNLSAGTGSGASGSLQVKNGTGDSLFKVAYDGTVTLSAGPTISSGSGTPEAAVTAPVGSLFMRTDGGAGTSLYVKESGSGNTGWVGK